MKKRLFFDMDNVLVKFQSGLDQIDDATKAKYVDANGKPHYDDIPGIFSLMEPVDGAIEAVKTLAKVYDVYILSTAPWNNPSAWSDKVKWVKKHFGDDENNPFYKRMIITHRKDLCEGDILIDDRGKNGTSEFKGEWIQFGSEKYPDWNAVVNYLIPHQEERNESKLRQLLKNRNAYSWGALIAVFFGELFAFLGIQLSWCVWGFWTFASILFIFALWITGACMHHKLNIRSVILTKLLANAIAPRMLGTIYLLFFVIHIGWLTNAAMSLFMPTDNLVDLLIAVGICVVGIIILICFFPDGRLQKVNNPRKVFVSGISNITVPYTNNILDLNLRPLVRILQETRDDNEICELLILKSDFNNATDSKISSDIIKVLEFILSPKRQEINRKMPINQQLGVLIREVAKKEFPEKHWLDSLQIEFTNACNYNVFDQCYKAIAEER